MDNLTQIFSERLAEIDTYLELLAAIEEQVRQGPPRIGPNGPVISTAHQRILYSSVYLQLYNLVEATVTKCIDAVCAAIIKDDRWQPADLSKEIRGEWVRHLARTHTDLTYENRLQNSMQLCEHLIQTLPVKTIEIEKGGGGNWDDEEIYRLATKRLGFHLGISAASLAGVKRPFRNQKGALALIVQLRNDLAHGKVSFFECGDNVTVEELRELKERTSTYLKEVVLSFKLFVDSYGFLIPERRPQEGVA